MAITHILVRLTATTVLTTLSAASLSAPARGTTATTAAVDMAITDVGVAMTTAATTGAVTGGLAAATVTPVVVDSITVAVASMAVKAFTAAAAGASMVVKASTAAGAADIGNSPRLSQQRTGTADSRRCQPFSIVRQLLVAARDNPILRPPTISAELSLTKSAKMAGPRQRYTPPPLLFLR